MGTFLSIFKIMLMRRYNPKFKMAHKLNIPVVTAVLSSNSNLLFCDNAAFFVQSGDFKLL